MTNSAILYEQLVTVRWLEPHSCWSSSSIAGTVFPRGIGANLRLLQLLPLHVVQTFGASTHLARPKGFDEEIGRVLNDRVLVLKAIVAHRVDRFLYGEEDRTQAKGRQGQRRRPMSPRE